MDRLTESNIAIMFGVLLASGFLLVSYNFLLHSCLIMFNDVWLEEWNTSFTSKILGLRESLTYHFLLLSNGLS